MEKSINIKRIELLLKRYIFENLNYEIMFWGIFVLLFTMVHTTQFFGIVLNLGGIIFTVRQYKSLNHTPSGIHFFMVPATQLEKLISTIILTTLYFFVMSIMAFIVGSSLAALISYIYSGTPIDIQWNVFATTTHEIQNGMLHAGTASTFWQTLGNFSTLQSVFLLGSLYFKRNTTAKTIISLIGIGILLASIELFIMQKVFVNPAASMQSISFSVSSNSNNSLGWISEMGGLLLTPYLWLICYYRLKEREV